MRECPGETLRNYIQRFSQVRNKIPRASDTASIAAFSSNTTDVKMLEKLSINDEIDSVVVLFDLTDRCSRDEEGRLYAHNNPDVEPDAAKPKVRDIKRKGPIMLVAEPEKKRGRDHDEAKKDGRPFCAYHNIHSHSTEDCHELKLLRDGR